ncbi:NAD-dependent epimerase/dehydratase family protein [Shimia sp.]|uniref:NAD-dependent epimerase/dehydratase family protein n=1 Tax=Shimia sp. TaxID=1954381 RepID=UPI0032978271
MSGPVAITGASGFIGRHTVAYARLIDVPVRALVRRAHAAPELWHEDRGIDIREHDLTVPEGLARQLEGAFAVVHTAGTLAGDHARDTMMASRTLLEAIVSAKVPHVVLVSSISVYDVMALKDHDTLNEDCPLLMQGRDAYSAAKLEQEHLFRDAACQHGFTLSVLRPGAVFGPGRAFNAHIGPAVGPVIAMIDGGGKVPVIEVNLLAECLIRAAQSPNDIETINIFDDALPDRDRFLKVFRQSGWPKVALHLPLGLARLLAKITPNGRRMPGLLSRPVLEARHKPLRYGNDRMHKRLGPVTMLPFETSMTRAIEIEQSLTK